MPERSFGHNPFSLLCHEPGRGPDAADTPSKPSPRESLRSSPVPEQSSGKHYGHSQNCATLLFKFENPVAELPRSATGPLVNASEAESNSSRAAVGTCVRGCRAVAGSRRPSTVCTRRAVHAATPYFSQSAVRIRRSLHQIQPCYLDE